MSRSAMIFGGAGNLGLSLVCSDGWRGLVGSIYSTGNSDSLDITDQEAVSEVIQRERPDLIINCAAFTAVDDAELEEEQAFDVNGRAVGHIAAAALEVDATLIHVSTDYVFDGEAGLYGEQDEPNPINAYGRTKLQGETAAQLFLPTGGMVFVVRTSWLWGPWSQGFIETALLDADRESLDAIEDQFGLPTYSMHLADAIWALARDRFEGGYMGYGIHHMPGGGPTASWLDFAREFNLHSGEGMKIVPIEAEELERPAPRPRETVLAVTNPATPRLPDWRHGIRDFFRDRHGGRFPAK